MAHNSLNLNCHTIETKKETSIPIIKIIISFALNEVSDKKPTIFKKLTPNIVGIAIKKLNSAAADLETPIMRAPIIVAPEREVPGIMASIWKKPIKRAVLYVKSETLLTLVVRFLLYFSTTIKRIP